MELSKSILKAFQFTNGFVFPEKESLEEKPCRHGSVDIVSAAIMAKVLEEREKERSQAKHCESCSCPVIGTEHHRSVAYSSSTLFDFYNI